MTLSSPLGAAAWLGYGRSMCGRIRLSSDVSEIELVLSSRCIGATANSAQFLRQLCLLKVRLSYAF
jgi:hypothetical protein